MTFVPNTECTCDPLGTIECDAYDGTCRCKQYSTGENCEICLPGHFGPPEKECRPCNCQKLEHTGFCDNNGTCACKDNIVGDNCNICAKEYYKNSTKGELICVGKCITKFAITKWNSETNHIYSEKSISNEITIFTQFTYIWLIFVPNVECECDNKWTHKCDPNTGKCICKPGVQGKLCNKCKAGFFLHPKDGCISCECNQKDHKGTCDDSNGECHCKENPGCDLCGKGLYPTTQDGLQYCESKWMSSMNHRTCMRVWLNCICF